MVKNIQQKPLDSPLFKELTAKQLYRDHFGQHPLSDKQLKNTLDHHIKLTQGATAGLAASYFTSVTGPETALHEYVGHGLLGFRLTHTYGPGQEPSYQVDGWDNFKQIFKSGSISDTFKSIGNFLIGHDYNNDGASGVAWNGTGTPNALGQAMGKDGLSAWISISGSIPSLVLTSASIAGGVAVIEKNPVAGYALTSFGLIQHLMSSQYSWSAAAMTESQIIREASQGHDFANFAWRMSKITGVEATTVAMTTAVAWTLFVPAVALGAYLYKKSQRLAMVPDAIAAQAWVKKSLDDHQTQQELEQILQAYPRMDKLQKVWEQITEKINSEGGLSPADHALVQAYQKEIEQFTQYLIKHIPKKSLKEAKIELLKDWQKEQAPNPSEKVLTMLAVAESGGYLASHAIQLAAKTFLPALAPMAPVLKVATPFLSAFSVIAGSYETYRDLNSVQIPASAKILSVAKLVATVAAASGIIAVHLVPGVAVAAYAALLIGVSASLVLGYAKHRVISSAFERQFSLQPHVWNSMFNQFKEYHHQGQDCRANRDLWKWIRYQHEAKALQMLNSEQLEQLEGLEFFTRTKPSNQLKLALQHLQII